MLTMILILLFLINSVNGAVKEEKTFPPSGNKLTPHTNCTFDACMALLDRQFCLNGGKCVTNQSTCSAGCTCMNGYSGEKCEYGLQRYLECSGEPCFHGNCVTAPHGRSGCQCDEGWFGTNCDIAGTVVNDDIFAEISRDFPHVASWFDDIDPPSKEQTHIVGEKDFVRNETVPNENDDSLSIEKENNRVENEVIPNSTEKQSFNLFAVNNVDADIKLGEEENATLVALMEIQRYNVCSEQVIARSDKERVCKNSPSLKCMYGVCEETPKDYGSWVGYIIVCKCDFGASGRYCEHKCCLDCGGNGKCDVRNPEGNTTQHCSCRQRYTGEFCEIYLPPPISVQLKEDTWYLWVVGVCVGTFLLLATLAVLGPYFMWKHRVILIMKIVHYFQPYEDNDEKEWDVFVSYKSHKIDEHFVAHVLYPKLEKELGFKLCLHFRDFIPGETISNNIINAVEGSRRTILILTPRYVESEFTRFEYQKAQTEMLKRKHKIIPIMLEDISSVTNMDKNLQGIINSVTYLEWPKSEELSKKEDKFWKRLILSLPKKKVNDSEQLKEIPVISKSEDMSVPSEWFESSKVDIKKSKNVPSIRVDSCDDNIYSEIGPLDDSCSNLVNSTSQNSTINDLSEILEPLTEEEELELIRNGSTDTDIDTLANGYVDMEHDRYIEFSLEDNPPSASLQRKQIPATVQLSHDNYIEIDV